MEREIPMGTVYDMCKIEHNTMPILTKDLVKKGLQDLELKVFIACGKKYFMLLCNERRDYTLFNFNGKACYDDATNDLLECLVNRGDIIDIQVNEDKVGEIWLRTLDDQEIHCYHLFPYDEGVLEY